VRDFSLSSREEEVLSGLADGLLYKEISDKLGISFAAVHKYSHNLYKKLGASNRSEAIRVWFDRGR
jgi:DNA-binding NarL/FixJ family response regulator